MLFGEIANLFLNTKAYIEGKTYDFENSTLDVSLYQKKTNFEAKITQ